MFKILPNLCSEVLPALPNHALRIFALIFFIYANKGYCLTISVYDVSQVSPISQTESPTNVLLRAPLVQQIEITELNQQGRFGYGRSVSSYKVESRPSRGDQGQSLERPENAGSFYLKTLKKSTKEKPAETKKKKKKKKTPEALNQCSMATQFPLKNILGVTRSIKRDVIIEDSSKGDSTYGLTVYGSGHTGEVRLDKPAVNNYPTEFVSEIQNIESRYGRYNWHHYDILQEYLADFEHKWNHNLIDLLLGIHCQFTIKALIVSDQNSPHLAVVVGYDLILEPQPDHQNGMHLFIQVELSPVLPAQIPLTHDIDQHADIAGTGTGQTVFQGFNGDEEYVHMVPALQNEASAIPSYEYVSMQKIGKARLVKLGLTAGQMIQVGIPQHCRDLQERGYNHRRDDFGDGGSPPIH